jgi:hypothetical protein
VLFLIRAAANSNMSLVTSIQGVKCESVGYCNGAGIEDFQKLTFGILAPRDLEKLLDVGGFGGHLDRIGKGWSDSE